MVEQIAHPLRIDLDAALVALDLACEAIRRCAVVRSIHCPDRHLIQQHPRQPSGAVCRCVEYPTALASHLGDKVGQQVVIIGSRGSAERVHQPARPAATTSLRGEVGGEAITITVRERLVSAQADNEAISVTLDQSSAASMAPS